MFLVDVFHAFLLGVSFDKCFVEISLQRISGRHISSRASTSAVENSPSSLKAPFWDCSPSCLKAPFWDCSPSCLKAPFWDCSPSSLKAPFWDCSPSSCRDFGEVISLHCFLRQNFILRDLLEEIPLQSFFGSRVTQSLIWDFGYGFLCRDFLVENVLQKVFGKYFLFRDFLEEISLQSSFGRYFFSENFSAFFFASDISWDILVL